MFFRLEAAAITSSKQLAPLVRNFGRNRSSMEGSSQINELNSACCLYRRGAGRGRSSAQNIYIYNVMTMQSLSKQIDVYELLHDANDVFSVCRRHIVSILRLPRYMNDLVTMTKTP
jgi:hypothetical protein